MNAQNSPQEQVERLLNQAEGKAPAQWAKLLMEADAEAVKMERQVSDGCCGYRCVRIHEYTLTFQWGEIGARETYQHDLLKTVVRAWQGTEIGAQALVRLLQPGCGPLANEWMPYFKLVLDILEFPPWRRVNDAGLIRIRAEAYETWWSLSKAAPDEPGLTDSGLKPQDFQPGAEEARLKAIAAYQELSAKDPRNRQAVEHLQKLRAGEDTHQRQWYCFGD
ncbi:MAG: hypothetical protein WB992_23390 [Bryobacteraceae bacterium]